MHAALRRCGPLALWTALWCAAPGGAQTLGGPLPRMDVAPARGVLTALGTTLDITRLAGHGADARYNWDADLGIDVDLFDLGFVRGNLLANLETIVGSELRDVDPNQNSYTTDFAVFVRLPRGELGATFHHVSRHLGDRADLGSVSWNMAGVVYGDRFAAGPVRVDAGARAMGTVERANVDYVAQLELHAAAELPINRRVSLVGDAMVVVVPVERAQLGRSALRGGRVLAGVRLPARVGAVDLLAGWEQRIDAGQFTRDTPRWFQLAVRLRTRAW